MEFPTFCIALTPCFRFLFPVHVDREAITICDLSTFMKYSLLLLVLEATSCRCRIVLAVFPTNRQSAPGLRVDCRC